MKEKVCLLHDIGWAGKDVDYTICEKCLTKSLAMYYSYRYDVVATRPAPP